MEPMEDQALSDADRIGSWAKVQPVGSVLRWADDGMGPGRHYGQGWMDVRALVDEDLGLNWWWTVVAPGDPEAMFTPGYGLAAFTVPQFDRYLTRAFPLEIPPSRRRRRATGDGG